MTPFASSDLAALTRRELFQRTGTGLGGIALATLLSADLPANESTSAPRTSARAPLPHFPPHAKSVIFLHMVGAPSQLELFENKPALIKHDGELVPQEYIEGKKFVFLRGHPKLL